MEKVGLLGWGFFHAKGMLLFKGSCLEHMPFFVVHLCVFQNEIYLQFNWKLLLGSESYSNCNQLVNDCIGLPCLSGHLHELKHESTI